MVEPDILEEERRPRSSTGRGCTSATRARCRTARLPHPRRRRPADHLDPRRRRHRPGVHQLAAPTVGCRSRPDPKATAGSSSASTTGGASTPRVTSWPSPTRSPTASNFDRAEPVPGPPPHFESYRGFVFLSVGRRHRGPRDLPRRRLRHPRPRSPTSPRPGCGCIGGSHLYSAKANWKLLSENSYDGYHALTTHHRYLADAQGLRQGPQRDVQLQRWRPGAGLGPRQRPRRHRRLRRQRRTQHRARPRPPTDAALEQADRPPRPASSSSTARRGPTACSPAATS